MNKPIYIIQNMLGAFLIKKVEGKQVTVMGQSSTFAGAKEAINQLTISVN